MSQHSPLYDVTNAAGAAFEAFHGYLLPANFGDTLDEYQAARSSAVVFDLSSRTKIEVTGAEAAMFLHNLCTNDITNMPIGAGCESFLATSTAKAVGFLNIYHVLLHDEREAFWLDMERNASERIMQHLDKYLISEQAEFADRTQEFAQIHLAGPQATGILERALLDDVPELDEHLHMIRTFGDNLHCHVRRVNSLNLPGYDIVCLNEIAPKVWQHLTNIGAIPAGNAAHEMLRVEAGLPIYGLDIDENRFVVEVGRIDQAISYEKGCYLGQEPIVMARDRGQAQRRLMGLKWKGDAPVAPGTILKAEEKEVGVTTSSVHSPSLACAISLGYIRRQFLEPGTTLLGDSEGESREAEVVPLPFSI